MASQKQEPGGDGENDDEPDDAEDDGAERRGDAGGGQEPEDRSGATGGACRRTDAEDTEAGAGAGSGHVVSPVRQRGR